MSETKTPVEKAAEKLRLAREVRDAGTTTPEGRVPGVRLTGAAWDAADAAVDVARREHIAAIRASREVRS